MDFILDYIPLKVAMVWLVISFLLAFGLTLKEFGDFDRESEAPEVEPSFRRSAYHFFYLIFIPLPFAFMVVLVWSLIATLGPFFILIGLILVIKSLILGFRCSQCHTDRATVKICVPSYTTIGDISGFYCGACMGKVLEIATTPERNHLVVQNLSPLKRVLSIRW